MTRAANKSNDGPGRTAAEIRSMLRSKGSTAHAKGVQWFFKEEIKSHGWYTGNLRKAARQLRRAILKERGLAFLLKVADKLFAGRFLEEKVFAVFLLEDMTGEFGEPEFRLFESWLTRVSSWADHDALVHDLISPMVVSERRRAARVFRWANSENRWHRRAACVALIRGTRQKMFALEIRRLTELLLADEDDMVQKGLGWLLRETAKHDPERTAAYLMKIRTRLPRLVLRTACETLPTRRRQILAKLS